MTYVRVTRDQRGYENTYLLYSPHPGERPRVLYWYRSAPGVRIGRPPLDEEAIRTIEEQHPEIEFDWPHLLEEATTTTPEVEQRPPRRRKAPRERPAGEPRAAAQPTPGPDPAAATAPPEPREAPEQAEAAEAAAEGDEPREPAAPEAPPPAARAPNPLLEQLVGREIAERLRHRYAEISTRIVVEVDDTERRAALQARAEALDPDRWDTVEAVLHGVEHADRLFDELRREL